MTVEKSKRNFQVFKKLSIFSLFTLSLLLVILLSSGIVSNPFIKEVKAEGEIEIYYLQELDAVRGDLTASYILMNDLDFYDDASYNSTDPDWSTKKTSWTTGAGWLPIGDSENGFSGSFDGNDKKISNLYISKPNVVNVGFIALLSPTGVLKDLGLINIDITTDTYPSPITYTGGAVAQIQYFDSEEFGSGGTISNVYTTGNIISYGQTGGLVGEANTSTITNSYSEVKTSFVDNGGTIGGLIGLVDSSIITNCYFSGLVTPIIETDAYYIDNVGGLIGISLDSIITNSYSTGTITGGYAAIGGLVGYADDTKISNSFSSMTVYGAFDLGGLVGYHNSTIYTSTNEALIENSYSTGEVINHVPDSYGATGMGGLVGYNNGIIQNSFATGDITGDADLGGLVGYSYQGRILNSYSTGNVSELAVEYDWGNIGGLIGDSDSDVINNCYSTGEVTITATLENAGGLIGKTVNNSTIANSFWDTESSSMDISGGGEGKTTAQMKSIATFNDTATQGLNTAWDIVPYDSFNITTPNIWYIQNSLDYARLFYEYEYTPGTEPEDPPVEEDIDPEVTTSSPTNISTTSATLNAILTNLGTFDSVYIYFKYKTTDEGIWVETPQVTKALTGSYSLNLASLSPNTKYEYASVINFGQTNFTYGDIVRFTTHTLGYNSEKPPEEEPRDTENETLPPETTTTPDNTPPVKALKPLEENNEIVENIQEVTTNGYPEREDREEKDSILTKIDRSIDSFTEKVVKTISDIKIDKKTATTIGTIGYAAATTAYVTLNFVTFTGANSISMLQILPSFFIIEVLKKKKQKYGIVYDSITKEPINMAIIRVLDSTDKLVTTVVTDIYGIFDLNIKQGQYRFDVASRDHIFPSKTVLGTNDLPYQRVYKGELVNYTPNQPLDISIPMDKEDKSIITKTLASSKSLLMGLLNVVLLILFMLGFAMTTLSIIKGPATISGMLLALYILSILALVYLNFKNNSSYGRVTTVDGTPVEGIEIGLRELEFNTLYAKRVSNESGKYRFILPKGKYRLESLNDNYIFTGLKENTFEVGEDKLYILGKDLIVKKV